MPVRLKDIARDLGVSTVTVSKVLRGNSDIGPRTRERVLERMRELNFTPNMLARGLASGRTYTIGLVVPDLVHPFFAEFAKAASVIMRQQHIALLLASSEEKADLEQEEIRALLSRGVDALLIASSQPDLTGIPDLGSKTTPFVLVDREFPGLTASFVGTDDYRAGILATEHLLSLGRRRLAHIGGLTMSPSRERLRGFEETLAAAGLPGAPDRIVLLEFFEEGGDLAGMDAMRKILKQATESGAERPDGVFCYNDLTAIGAIEAILQAGLRVPEDIAVIGCGNLRYNRYLRVPLSSIDQQPELLGRRAAEMAMELVGQPALPPRRVLEEPRLIVRASTGGSGPSA